MDKSDIVHLRVKVQAGSGPVVPACQTSDLPPEAAVSMTDDRGEVTCEACRLVGAGASGLATRLPK